MDIRESVIDKPKGIHYSAGMVVIEFPEDMLDSARLTVGELKIDIAVSLYEAGRLSIGKARELADMTLWQFRQLLASRGIPPHFDEHDLLDDFHTLQELGRL